jgi:hypothetical protein
MLDDYLKQLLKLIDEHGWAVQHVGGGDRLDEPPFSYTVGLTALGHPEFILFGMPPDAAQQLLNILGSEVQNGRRYRPDTLTSDPTEAAAPVALIEVIDPASHLLAAVNLYAEIEALQVIWPDPSGRLPWDDGYPNPPEAQPFLGVLPEVFERSTD